jgi:hypothetical protein
MAETSFPFDAGAGSSVLEDGWSRMARMWARSGIMVPDLAGGVGALAAGAITGCKVALGTGLQVTVAVGEATVKGFYYANDASKALTVAANASGNPRLDWVVLELDRVNNQILAKIVQGTPAASPVLPALTQVYNGVYQHPIGYYTVVNAASVPSALTDYRTAAVMPDGVDGFTTFKAASQAIVNGAPVKLTWNNGFSGNSAFFSVANNWFVAPFAGWYYMEARVYFPSAATSAMAELIVNNTLTNVAAHDYTATLINGFCVPCPKTIYPLSPGDTVYVNGCPFAGTSTPDVASTFRVKYWPGGI